MDDEQRRKARDRQRRKRERDKRDASRVTLDAGNGETARDDGFTLGPPDADSAGGSGDARPSVTSLSNFRTKRARDAVRAAVQRAQREALAMSKPGSDPFRPMTYEDLFPDGDDGTIVGDALHHSDPS